MSRSFIVKISVCLLTFAVCLYSYIEKQNELTQIKIEVPKVFAEIENLKEEIKKMQYEVESFENPQYLMQMMQKPRFGHLKHPFVEEVLMLKEGVALFDEKDKSF